MIPFPTDQLDTHKPSWTYRELLRDALPERLAQRLITVALATYGSDTFRVWWTDGYGRLVWREYPTRDWLTDALIARIVLEAL